MAASLMRWITLTPMHTETNKWKKKDDQFNESVAQQKGH